MADISAIGLPTQQNVQDKSEDRIWDIRVVRELHVERIKKWLQEQANEKIPLSTIGHDKDNADKLITNAKEHYLTLSHELERTCSIDGITANYRLMQDAEQGKLQDAAPTTSAIFFWVFLLLLAGGLELTFFTYMVFFKDAGPALVGLAILLIVGGLFVGNSIATLMAESHKAGYEEKEIKIAKKYLVLLGIGISLIAGITTMRWVYGGPLAGIVAVFFGLAVSTTDSFLSYDREMRKFYLNKMFQAQKHYALVHLRQDLRDPNDHKDDTWYVFYTRHIDDMIISLKSSTSGKPKK